MRFPLDGSDLGNQSIHGSVIFCEIPEKLLGDILFYRTLTLVGPGPVLVCSRPSPSRPRCRGTQVVILRAAVDSSNSYCFLLNFLFGADYDPL